MIRHSLLTRENLDKTAVISDAGDFTYRDLARKASAIQRRLPRAKRENIAIFLPNGERYIAALYGVMMAGMTAFPLSTRLTAYEVAPLLEQAAVPIVITARAYRTLFEDVLRAVSVRVIYVEALPEHENGGDLPAAKVGEDEPMILLATSGTTGNEKIVRLSERNVAASTNAYIDKMDFDKFPKEQLRLTLGTPFSSVYGLMVLTACVIKSIPVVVLREAFTLDALFMAAEKYKLTHYEGGVSVGLLMAQMAGRPIRYDISSFRYFGLAGSKISADTLRRLTEAYPGVEFWSGYGMTEAGPLIAKPDKCVNMNKLDSVGTKIGCITILVDANGTLTDAPYTKGEIAVKGPNVMLGYLNNEEETRKAIRGGYLYTGDIGYLDEEGYLYICGRKKNVIIVRGFNVHAEEVETSLLGSGLAKDCVVYGETDPLGNETVCAKIVPASPQVQIEQIRAYCRAHLADYKRPQKMEIIDDIQKTETGKTKRT